MANYEVQTVKLSGGREIPASMLVCPVCKKLDIYTEIDTSEHPWKCRCSKGHEFEVNALIH